MDGLSTPHYEFGGFRLDTAQQHLIGADGAPVPLPSRAFDTLRVLVEHAGELVEKASLMRAVWPKTVVEDNNLNQCISAVRRALGDNSDDCRFILTVPGRGFKFVAPVVIVPRVPAQSALHGSDALRRGAVPKPRATLGRRVASGALASLVTAAVIIATDAWITHRAAPATTPFARSVAVLPFVDMSEKRDQGYFADGITDEITDLLARGSDLRVPSRTSTYYYQERKLPISELARALGVAHVLEGSVRRSGDRVRITAQLIRADNGYHEWSGSFDRAAGDVFATQDEIAGAVVATLKASLLGARAHRSVTGNAEAHTLYLQARAILTNGTTEDNHRAVEYLREVVALDPKYAAAWALLARARVMDFGVYAGTTLEAVRGEAMEAAARAIALEPELADAHLARAAVLRDLDWDIDGAEAAVRRAVELDPSSPDAVRAAASIAQIRGDAPRAIGLAERSVELDPVDSVSWLKLAEVQWFAGRLTDAERSFRKEIELRPTAYDAHIEYGALLMTMGRPRESLAEIDRDADTNEAQVMRPIALELLGRTAEAQALMPAVEQRFAGVAAHEIAMFYATGRDNDRAFAWLDRAVANRETIMLFLKDDPPFRALHGDPRFATLLRRLKLAA